MALRVDIQLRGWRETIANILSKIQLGKRYVADGLENTAKQVVNDAKRLAPGGTGRLRESIKHRRLKDDSVYIGSNLAYAAFVEYGTAARGRISNKQQLPEGYRHGQTHNFPPIRKLLPYVNSVSEAYALGWNISSKSKGGRNKLGGVRAQPYLGPALEANKSRIKADVAAQIKRL